jgi:polyketide synthase PksM
MHNLQKTASYSAAQRLIQAHAALYPESTAFNLPALFKLREDVDLVRMKDAIVHVIKASDILSSNKQFQKMESSSDLSGFSYTVLIKEQMCDRPDEVYRVCEANSQFPFDISAEPLYRITLYRCKTGEQYLYTCFHHLVFDAISLGTLIRRIEARYAGNPISTIQPSDLELYSDYIQIEQQSAGSTPKSSISQLQAAFERRLLRPLGGDLPVFDTQRALYAKQKVLCESSVSRWIQSFCKSHKTTPCVVYIALYAYILSRIQQSDFILLNTPVDLRPGKAYDRAIGNYMNPVILGLEVHQGLTLETLVDSVSKQYFEGLALDTVPYLNIIEGLKTAVPTNQIIDSGFNFQSEQSTFGTKDGCIDSKFIASMDRTLSQVGEYELGLDLVELSNGSVELIAKFNQCRYSSAIIETILLELKYLIENTEELFSLSLTDISARLQQHQKQALISPSFFTAFSDQAARWPEKIAARFRKDTLTYKQLEEQSDRVADYLIHFLAQRQSVIGLYMERGIELLPVILGIMKSGNTFLPLDPIYPADRIEYMLQRANAVLVIHTSDTAPAFAHANRLHVRQFADTHTNRLEEGGGSATQSYPSLSQADICYIIFTSGSTGQPKGVAVGHYALNNFLEGMRQRLPISAADSFLALTTICFDICYLELLLPLYIGATVEIAAESLSANPVTLARYLESQEISVVQATPTAWRVLLAAGWSGNKRMLALSGGESLSKELAANLLSKVQSLWNMYGPTEATIWCSLSEVKDAAHISLGTAIPNMGMVLLDHHGHKITQQQEGEVCLYGDGLAFGYINDEKETAKRFVVASPDGIRRLYYRTGDSGSLDINENITYLGRIDTQVKINGYRIELDELSTVIESVPEVIRAVAVVRKRAGKSQHEALVYAFVQAVDNSDLAVCQQRIRDVIEKQLPAYMHPFSYMFLKGFPTTKNNKTDTKTLAEADLGLLSTEYGLNENANASSKTLSGKRADTDLGLEQQLTRIIAEAAIVQVDQIARDVNIGTYGFNSISYTDLSVTISRSYGVEVTPADFFQHETVRKIAALVIARQAQRGILMEGLEPTSDLTGQNQQSPLDTNDIAIVGMSGRYPEGETLAEFWHSLKTGQSFITEIPNQRWDWNDFVDDQPRSGAAKWGSFLSNVDAFDAAHFNISRPEAEAMDPQQRILMELTWHCFEDAGYRISDYSNSRTGVYIGSVNCDYLDLVERAPDAIKPHTLAGISKTMLPNRLSFIYNFTGPSLIFDTACSSSLVAVNRAVKDLQAGICELAIAGGINLILTPFGHSALIKNEMLSEDGKCRTFDEKANGYVRGEGAGLLLLKPLDKALADKDNIYAVIKSSSENHGGHANSLTAPNPIAQQTLVTEVLKKAQLSPLEVDYIEAHGTGTALGDPIEINALKAVFAEEEDAIRLNAAASKCLVGSVKSNIGHLEGAAGIAGIQKTVLSMQAGWIPGNPNLSKLNGYIDLHNQPLEIVKNGVPWPLPKNGSGKKIALVNSFGFGGVNASVLLQCDEPVTTVQEQSPEDRDFLFVLSARTTEQLLVKTVDLLSWIDEQPNRAQHSLNSIAYVLQTGREEYPQRLAIIASNTGQLRQRLRAFIDKRESDGMFLFHSGTTVVNADYVVAGVSTAGIGKTNNSLAKLAVDWVDGATVDWTRLYAETPRKISMPLTSFAKTSYWLEYAKQFPAYNNSVQEKGLRESKVYSIALSKEELELSHHKIDGVIVTPATWFMASLRKTVEEAYGQTPGIRGFTLVEPLRVIDQKMSVSLRISPAEKQFQFAFISQDIETIVYCSGFFGFPGPLNLTKTELPDVSAPSCVRISKGMFYERLGSHAMEYGAAYQLVDTSYLTGNSCLSELNTQIEDTKKSALHATVLDTALQCAALLMMEAGKKTSTEVPFYIEEIDFGEVQINVKYAFTSKGKAGTINSYLLSDDGQIAAIMKGITYRPFLSPQHTILVPEWRAVSVSKKTIDYPEPAPDIVFYTIAAKSLLSLSSWTSTTTLLLGGEEGASSELIDDVIQRCLATIQNSTERKSLHVACFVLFPSDTAFEKTGSFEYQEQQLSKDFYTLLSKLCVVQDLRLTIFTRFAHALNGAEVPNPYSSALLALAQAFSAEHPDVCVRHIDLGEEAGKSTVMVTGLGETSGSFQSFLLRAGVLYERNWNPFPGRSGGMIPWKTGDNILITGGTGGLGLELIDYLSQTVSGLHFILLGRSAFPSPASGKRIEEFQKRGESIVYMECDIRDDAEAFNTLAKIKFSYGRIDHIFHLAGIVELESIRTSPFRKIMDTAAAKIKGCTNIYRSIDPFSVQSHVFFSSLSSVIPTPNQVGYQLGCVFQDSYATLLRAKGVNGVCTINWSFWTKAGIVARNNWVVKVAQQTGQTGLETAAGMAALQTLIKSGISTAAVLGGQEHSSKKPDLLRQRLILNSNSSVNANERTCTKNETVELRKEWRDTIEAFDRLDNYCAWRIHKDFFAQLFAECGLLTAEDIVAKNAFHPKYQSYLSALLIVLERHGFAEKTTDKKYKQASTERLQHLNQIRPQSIKEYRQLIPYIELVDKCAFNLHQILSGKLHFAEILFNPDEKSGQSTFQIYAGNTVVDSYSQLVADKIVEETERRLTKTKGRKIKILELGAGSGATTGFVINRLLQFRQQVELHFSDLSIKFLESAKETFSDYTDFLHFDILNAEEPGIQGEYDIVYATNVLHATSDISVTLGNIRDRMTPGGLLLVSELVKFHDFSTLVFGITDGWWAFKDPSKRISYSPILSVDSWISELAAAEFSSISRLLNPYDDEQRAQQAVLIAYNGKLEGFLQEPEYESFPYQTPELDTVTISQQQTFGASLSQGGLHNSIDSLDYRHEPRMTQQQIADAIKSICAAMLKITPDDMLVDRTFQEYGVDSLLFIQLKRAIEKELCAVEIGQLFENNSVSLLSEFLYTTGVSSREAVVQEQTVSAFSEGNTFGETYAEEDRQDSVNDTDIAVIGISARYPDCESPEQLWELLKSGGNCIREGQQIRWPESLGQKLYPSDQQHRTYPAAYLSRPFKFDREFFGFSMEEAMDMDPQERILLEEVWKLLEDAGYTPESIGATGNPVGVFIGTMYSDYAQLGLYTAMEGHFNHAQSSLWLIANRISKFYKLTGPSLTVDSACSSSLTALHLACNSILTGDSTVAIVGGISLILSPLHQYRLDKLNNLSPDNETRPFSEHANGFVVGEGAGTLLLKRLKNAITDADNIYGIIKGSALNTGGYFSPDPNAQSNVIAKAHARAGVSADSISYLEAHGTGTKLGDPVEIHALKKIFDVPGAQLPCAVGSLKGNFGHLEGAAGVCAVTKVLLQLRYKQIAPTIHCEPINPFINLQRSRLVINTALTEWPSPKEPTARLRAGISAFGAGGANAHIVIEEYCAPACADFDGDTGISNLFLLSAETPGRLVEKVKDLIEFVRTRQFSESGLRSMAFTLQVGRTVAEERIAVIAKNRGELLLLLEKFVESCSYGEGIKSNRLICAEPSDDSYRYLTQFAGQWLSDGKLDWLKQYNGNLPHRISLPVRKFQGDDYSVLQLLQQPPLAPARPLLTHAAEYSFADPIIQDHKTFEKCVLIGASYVSLFINHLYEKITAEGQPVTLRRVQFLRPAILEPGTRLKAYCSVDTTLKNITCWVDDYCGHVIETATAVLPGECTIPNINLDIQRFIASRDRTLSGEHLYTYKKPGIYGRSLYTVESCFIKGREILSYIRLSEQYTQEVEQHVVHAAMLDGAVVSRYALQEDVLTSEPFIPFFIKNIYVKAPVGTEAYAHVKEVFSNEEIWTINVGIFDTSGALLVYIEELTYKKVHQRSVDGLASPVAAFQPISNTIHQNMDTMTKENAPIPDRPLAHETLLRVVQETCPTISFQEQDKSFFDLGLTSAEISKLAERLSLAFAAEIYPTTLFEFPSVKTLARHLSDSYGQPANVDERDVVAAGLSGDVGVLQTSVNGDSAMSNEGLSLGSDNCHSRENKNSGALAQKASPQAPNKSVANNLGIGNLIKKTISRITQRPIEFSADRSFLDLGLTSAELTALTSQLESACSKELFPTLLFEFPSIDQLTSYFIENSFQFGVLESPDLIEEQVSIPVSDNSCKVGSTQAADESRLLHNNEIRDVVYRGLMDIVSGQVVEDESSFHDLNIPPYLMVEFASKLSGIVQKKIYPGVFWEVHSVGGFIQWLENNIPANSHSEFLTVPAEAEEDCNVESPQKAGQGTLISNVQALGNTKPSDIAIIGIAAKLPGAETVDDFWEKIKGQHSLITSFPADRLIHQFRDSEVPGEIGSTPWKGSFLDGVYDFDPAFFQISPREAELMDPQHRMILQLCWSAIEDAGYNPDSLAGSDTGVFVGVSGLDYSEILRDSPVSSIPQWLTGNSHTMLTSRVSYFLNFHGPSISIDTACSSSLVAVQHALQAIRSGECKLALVGGVNAILAPSLYLAFDQTGMLSKEGNCRPFDKAANGFVRGEGAGIILLKSLEQARRDGDHVYAVIKGAAINHGGKSSSLTAPNIQSQAAVITAAARDAAVPLESISFIEAHGTGTRLGDPIEIKAIRSAFDSSTSLSNSSYSCGVSTVKSNIGHLEAAAGIAGLIKAVFSLRNAVVPGLASFSSPNPFLELSNSGVYLVTDTIPWPEKVSPSGDRVPRRMGVSGFGFGGVNAHVILEEYSDSWPADQTNGPLVFPISAPSDKQLFASVAALSKYLSGVGRESNLENERAPESLEQRLGQLLAKVLRCPDKIFDRSLPFGKLGLSEKNKFDYLLAVNDDLGIFVPMTAEFLSQSIESLSVYLRQKFELPSFVHDCHDKSAVYGTHNDSVSLASVAHTLQTGRKEFEKRAAFVASGKKALLEQISEFLKQDEDSGVLRVFSETAAAGSQSEALAGKWTAGQKIAWPALSEKGPILKCSLPGYAFKKESFRVPVSQYVMPKSDDNSSLSLSKSPMNPAIDSKGRSMQILLNSNDPFLKDHRVFSVPTLPGVMYLELLRHAVQQVYALELKQVNDLIWKRPLICPEKCVLTIDLNQLSKSEFSFSFFVDQQGLRVECASGSLNVQSGLVEPDKQVGPFVTEKASLSLTSDEFYELFKRTEFEYGPLYRSVEQVSLGEKTATAIVDAKAESHASHGTLRWHPSIFDGALQLAGYMANFDILQRGAALIPARLQSVKVFRAIPTRCRVAVSTSVKTENLLAESRCFDILITDIDGNRVALLEGYTLAEMDEPEAKVGRVVVPEWQEIDLSNHSSKLSCLCVYLGAITASAYLGTGSEPIDMNELLGNKHSLENLELTDTGISIFIEPDSSLLQGLTQVDKLFNFIRLVSARFSKKQIKVNVIWKSPSAAGYPPFSAIPGFARSLYLENPNIQLNSVQVVDWESNPLAVAACCSAERGGESFKIENGKLYRQELRIRELLNNRPASALREGGVYLVTGGTGGIGFQVAQSILKESKCTVVLLARHTPGRLLQAQIEKLNKDGRNCVFLSCDVADEQQTRTAIEGVISRYGQVNGVFHFAGVTGDGLFSSKSPGKFSDDIAAKVKGAVFLDSFCSGPDFDFLVMASSISAVLGNQSQTSYAYANLFLDSYCAYRRQLNKTSISLAVNWPFWNTGGMSLSTAARQHLDQALSISSITTNEGLAYLRRGLHSGYSSFMVTGGDPADFLKKYTLGRVQLNDKKYIPVITDGHCRLQNSVNKLVCGILGIRHDAIESDQPLRNWGLDSITISELCKQISKDIGIDISPADILSIENLSVSSLTHFLVEAGEAVLVPTGDTKVLGPSLKARTTVSVKPNLPLQLVKVKDIVAEVLGMPANAVENEVDLSHYGVNSILLAELARKLGTSCGATVSAATLLEMETLTCMAICELPGLYQSADLIHQAVTTKSSTVQSAHESAGQIGQLQQEGQREESLAIVGIGLRLPNASSVDDCWQLLLKTDQQFSGISAKRKSFLYPTEANEADTQKIEGSFLENVDEFDPAFFGIQENEARNMDPQQRLLLSSVWHTLEDANLPASNLRDTKTGVFVGVSSIEYNDLLAAAGSIESSVIGVGNAGFWIANRISHHFNLNGPSVAIDTACSSSSTALHMAALAIARGDCESAIVAGVNLQLSPARFSNYRMSGVLSESGAHMPFNPMADGFVRGDGVIAILIMPEDLARSKGLHTYAVIKGSALTHAGQRLTVSSAGVESQASAIRAALFKANAQSTDISYIEAHGAATRVGDTAELKALESVFATKDRDITNKRNIPAVGIGSVKTHLGHLEAASGLAAIVKTALCIDRGTLPPIARPQFGTPMNTLVGGRFKMVDESREWRVDGPKLACVNCYGAGGSNAAFILGEAKSAKLNSMPNSSVSRTIPLAFPFSAACEESLIRVLTDYISFIEKLAESDLERLSYTLIHGRSALRYRQIVLAATKTELLQLLSVQLSDLKDGSLELKPVFNRRTDKIGPVELAKDACEHWLAGEDQALDHFFRGSNGVQMLKLPLYPFKNKTYWFTYSDKDRRPLASEQDFPIASCENEHYSQNTLTGIDIKAIVRSCLAEVSGAGNLSLDSTAQQEYLKLDSIYFMKFRMAIKRSLGVQVPMKDFFDARTIDALCQICMDLYESKDKSSSTYATDSGTVVPTKPEPHHALISASDIDAMPESALTALFNSLQMIKIN